MRRGFLYLVAIMDWVSRRVLAWRLPNTMDADFCIEALRRRVGAVFGDPVVATAILDRLFHHSQVTTICGDSYRQREMRRSGLLQKAGPALESTSCATGPVSHVSPDQFSMSFDSSANCRQLGGIHMERAISQWYRLPGSNGRPPNPQSGALTS